MKRNLCILLSLTILILLSGCDWSPSNFPDESDASETSLINENAQNILTFKDGKVECNGQTVSEYNYVWNFDPSHAEPYYTGDKPSTDDAVYVAHDIIYYPQIDENLFSKENYDGETEWTTYYTAEGLNEYIFATLPVLGDEFPSDMMHSSEEAFKNPVVHITRPGEYVLSGSWNGQILVDLNDDDAFTNENAKVTLLLDGVDITCSVAPAVIFKNVYECDNEWEDRTEYGNDVDITNAGARVILADGSENNVTGTNVFRILKPQYKKEGSSVQKKLVKTDGAFYSYVSMLVDGQKKKTGILNITNPEYEGLDSELHLSINGGYINIVSGDDGINVNEDNVSVFTLNEGHLTIFAGQGAEGDVIDSNGYITINGGFIAGTTPSMSDDILDCDCDKKVSDEATVISSFSGAAQGGKMPGGDMPQGEPPAMDPPPEPPER